MLFKRRRRSTQTLATAVQETHAQTPVIAIRDVTKVYQMGQTKVHALRGVSTTIMPGEYYAGVSNREASARAQETLEKVGLDDRTHHRPDELSSGQQQRVAIARALVNRPSLLLADEPTGALDSKTGADILNLFADLHGQGLTLLVVTHDMNVARQAERIVTLNDGLIVDDTRTGAAESHQRQGALLSDNMPIGDGNAAKVQ